MSAARNTPTPTRLKEAGFPDSFIVANGPEDGIEFPIVSAPVSIGHDDSCVVQIRLDKTVQRHHARVTPVLGGYKIRAASAAPIYVDEKRASALRSRIVREGGRVRVGHTELVLQRSEDGLASRRHASIVELDAVWLVRGAMSTLFRSISYCFRLATRLPLYFLRYWPVAFLLMLVLLYFTLEPYRDFINRFLKAVVGAFN